MGWIGRSCLLITLSYSPRVRLSTLLTDAPLDPGAPIEAGCGNCRACVAICPVKAFTGAPFNPAEGREARYDARKCDEYFKTRRESTGRVMRNVRLRLPLRKTRRGPASP
ncbi:MAG: 4Fe-4S dicluster domain-containing protein [Candidatus Bathyarchaeia archaeon]